MPCHLGYIPSPLSGSCLKFYRENKTWSDADDVCKKSKGHLVKIADSGMEKFVMGLLPNYTDSYWIGLGTNNNFTFLWSLRQDVQADYVNFAKHVPSMRNAVIKKNHKHWLPVSELETHSFICELDPGDLCPLDWTVSPHSRTCIKLSGLEEKSSWVDARQRCQNLGGDLVITLNRAMFNFVSDQFSARNLYGALNNKDYWVGLNDIKTEGTFQWLEFPDQVTFTEWEVGQPSNDEIQDCVAFNFLGSSNWYDLSCTRRARFVCEKYSDCKNEKWGMICRKNCELTNCKGEFDNPGNKGTSCNKTTGHCLYGCEDGYRGVYCDIHDKDCTLTNCKGEFDNPGNKSTSCNKTTGHCLYGCEDGYRGVYCDIHVMKIKTGIMKLLISGLIIAMSIFAVYCCTAICIECVGHKEEEAECEKENVGGFKEALQSDTVSSGQGFESEV